MSGSKIANQCLVLRLCAIIIISLHIAWADDSFTWRSGSPENLPKLQGLNVECGQDDMVVYLKFDKPFDGSIYSKGSARCVHVASHSHITEATFTIEYNSCNTRSDPKGKYYENTIVIQYDDAVIEAWDIAKKIRCEWHDGYEKSAFKQPITISDLDVVEMNFQGDDVDCWLEIQDGKGPWSSKVEGLVPLGSPLTLVVAIQDTEGYFDMRVKSCKAHDGHKHPVYLTDEDGCVLRPKMMSPFTKTRETKGTASVVAYSHFYAFKFPETVDVNVQCTVEICRHGCPDLCDRDAHFISVEKPALHKHKSGGEQSVTEDIPTYRDSYPHSSIITNKPHRKSNNSSPEDNENATANKDLEISNSHPAHNFLPAYPPGLFDALNDHLEDNLEDYDQFEDRKTQNSDYEEDKLQIDIAKIPDFLKKHFSNRKGFPGNHQMGKEFTNSKQPEEDLQMNPEPLIQHDNDTTNPTENESKIMMTTDYSTAISNSSNNGKNDIRTFEVFTTPSLLETTSEMESNLITHDIDSNITANFNDSRYNEGSFENTPPEYQEDFVEVFDVHKHVDDFQIPMHSDEITLESENPLEEHYEEYKINPVQGRMPMKSHKSSEITKKSYQNYKPFKPPFPLPPLTFYNGIPLHYYHQQKAHMERKVHPRKYEDSIAFRGTTYRGRRFRREIGEKEQLGLQQSFRVISPADLDFIIPNNKQPKVEQTETQTNNICMASTSFTAGLGLLLLANICGAGIATFLAYHYFIHRKTKVKALELLSKDTSS